ncbi:MAG: ATPase domain-containing protein, partial [Cystobacter sp.]
MSSVSTLERISTGDPALDGILRGGIPTLAVTVLAGEPGTGKTVLALQLLFNAARKGQKCLYFTSIAEPPTKLFRYMETFEFFDAKLLEEKILFVDLDSVLRQGPAESLRFILRELEKHEPAIVVMDSFRAISEVLHLNEGGGRTFVYELAVQLATWGTTSLLVGEYTLEDLREQPIFGIADAIIRVRNTRQELTTVREVEVMKLRGSDFVSGQHFFEI